MLSLHCCEGRWRARVHPVVCGPVVSLGSSWAPGPWPVPCGRPQLLWQVSAVAEGGGGEGRRSPISLLPCDLPLSSCCHSAASGQHRGEMTAPGALPQLPVPRQVPPVLQEIRILRHARWRRYSCPDQPCRGSTVSTTAHSRLQCPSSEHKSMAGGLLNDCCDCCGLNILLTELKEQELMLKCHCAAGPSFSDPISLKLDH